MGTRTVISYVVERPGSKNIGVAVFGHKVDPSASDDSDKATACDAHKNGEKAALDGKMSRPDTLKTNDLSERKACSLPNPFTSLLLDPVADHNGKRKRYATLSADG